MYALLFTFGFFNSATTISITYCQPHYHNKTSPRDFTKKKKGLNFEREKYGEEKRTRGREKERQISRCALETTNAIWESDLCNEGPA